MSTSIVSPEVHDAANAMAEDLRRLADIVERNPMLEPLLRKSPLQRLYVWPEHASVHASAVTDLLRAEWCDMDIDTADPAYDIDTAAMPNGSVVVQVIRHRNVVKAVGA